jgi:hypothetical protein
MNEVNNPAGAGETPKKPEAKTGAPVKCKLQFKGMIQYGKAIRKVNGRKYELSIDKPVLVEAQDVEALKKREPNLYIIEK